MLQFLKFVLATVVGIVLTFFLIIGLIFLFIPDDTVTIDSKSVLRLQLNQPILERSIDNPLDDVATPFTSSVGGLGLVEIKELIDKAQKDDNIKGILLQLSFTQAGFASLEEIRNALIDFKKSGKFIYAYGEIFSEGAYYLASVADKIYLNPAGGMELNGLTAQIQFYKGTLDKLDVKPLVFRVGDFKSAVEPYIRENMSEESRTQLTSYLNSIYDFYLKNVAESRKIKFEQLKNISENALVQTSEDALQYKLVTDVAYYPEVEKAIKAKLDLKEDQSVSFTDRSEYSKVASSGKTNTSRNRIAVIVAAGEIYSGSGDETVIGSETIAKEIRKARQDDRVKAIVLRINSPGGSALASDVMWREIQLAKQEKPVIASMSDVAASGGYYIAMGCDQILAHPNTITGSIGVFGVLFNVQGLYAEKLGITSDRVSTGKFPDIRSILLERELSEEEQKMIQSSINQVYEDFTSKAAKGRNMSQEEIKKIASGRVWSGAQAKQNGLIDEFGGLEAAIKLAAKEAELEKDDYRVRYYPAQKSFVDKLLDSFNTQVKIPEQIFKEKLGEFYPYYQLLERIKRQDRIQARLPFDFSVE